MPQAKSLLFVPSFDGQFRLGGGAWTVLIGAIAFLVLAGWMYPSQHWFLLATSGATLLCLFGGVLSVAFLRFWLDQQVLEQFKRINAWERVPTFITDAEGKVVWQNSEAELFFRSDTTTQLSALLSNQIADPLKLTSDLRARATIYGNARETRTVGDKLVHISVLAVSRNGYIWRMEEVSASKLNGVDGKKMPMVRLDGQDNIVLMTDALTKIVGPDKLDLNQLVSDLPLNPGGMNRIQLVNGQHPMHIQVTENGAFRDVCFFPAHCEKVQDDGALFDTLPVPLVKLNATGGIVLANRGARVLLGDDIPPGRHLSDLVSGLGRSVSDWLQDAINGRGLNRSEFLQVTKQTKDVFVQVTLKRLPEDDEGELVAVLNDATELKTLEAQFVQSQKMQAIGQLAGGVAHDFNNLLTAISGHCDLLMLRHDQGDPEYADLVQIHQNTNRAASLVGQLLAFSRKQTLQPEIVDLRDTLSELTHLLNRLVGEKISLTLKHDPDLQSIRADKRQLEQVIMNLVVNSRDAMPGGGEITIETEALRLEHEIKRNRAAIPAGAYSVVRVIDHGAGIPPDKVTKVFEPFYTTKRTGEGTGLGLSTAYGIVKQTGGFIFVESEVGVGTTFILYFPAHFSVDTAADIELVPEEEERAAQGTGVVLLVEDEAPVRAFASRALRLRGYTVLEAESAEQALETLEDGDLNVDVFVTDVVMPGMDGPSWVKEALKVRPDTRVVFVSGYAEDALADHKSRIPNSVFLPKPFSLNDLTKTVQSQFKSRMH